MSLQSLDRTQWSFAEALAHVQNVTIARRAVEGTASSAQAAQSGAGAKHLAELGWQFARRA